MRLTLATVLMMASAPAWAGASLLSDGALPDQPSVAPAAPAPVPAAAPKPAAAPTPYAALYDAPLFGHLSPAVDRVDETALRFYASQKNRPRVDAEIKRLRALHPSWTVPANLYANGSGNDEQPLWDLFASGRIEELHAAIQARETREPGWRPSADLLAKTARQEAATALKTLSEAKDWSGLLTLAAAHPEVLSCGTIDLDWRVAEAFAMTGAPERAYEVDAAILKSCKDRDERLATVRKAVDLMPADAVERLVAAGDVLPDGSGEFDEVRLDLARRGIGRALAATGDDPAKGGEGADRPGTDVDAASLEALASATLRSGAPSDAALLGWYAFHKGRWADADGWFKLGLSASAGDVKMVEGHALALKELGRTEEAEEIARAWRDRSSSLRGLFVALMTDRLGGPDPASIDAAALGDFDAVLMADRNVAAAGALGWIAYGRKDMEAAALWFGRAVDWAGTGTISDKIAEGYGLTLKSIPRLDAAEAFLFPRRAGSPVLRDLYVSVAISALSGAAAADPENTGATTTGAGTADDGRRVPAISPEILDHYSEAIRAARSAPGAAALGWRNLRDGRPAAAIDWFDQAADWSGERPLALELVEGRVLALKDGGRLAEAEDAAYARLSDSARLRQAYAGIMLTQLTTPALADALRPERVARFASFVEAEASAEGAEALGWYRLADPGCGHATEWFRRAVRWSPDRKGSAKGNEGLALALARDGHDLEADDVASAWTERTPDMKALSVKVLVEGLTRDLFPLHPTEDRLDRFAALVREQRSVSGAQALGWYRYRDAGNGYGVEWFADAIRWSPDQRADAKTVEGYASALRDVGRLADAEEALFPFVASVAAMRDLYIDTVVSELTLDNPPEPMPHDRLARFIAVATPIRSAAAAQALGWYRFARGEYPDAAIWFKYAVDWWPALPPDADRFTYAPEGYRPLDAHLALEPEGYRRTPRAFASRAHEADAAAHRYVDTLGGLATTWTGYALTLRALGRGPEAEDIAFAWRDRWPALGRLFVDLAIDALTRQGTATVSAERLKRFAAVIEEERDAGGAAALGWAAMNRHDPAEAAVWLKAATDWRPADAALDGRMMAGYVDALRLSGRIAEAFAAADAWADKVPEVKSKLVDIALDVLAGAVPAGGDGSAPAIDPDRLARAVKLAGDDSGARGPAALGWYYLGTKQAPQALAAFRVAVTRAGDAAQASPAATKFEGDAAELPKAVEGYALALRALGRDADALAVVAAWSAKFPAMSALSGDVVADLLGRAGSDARLPVDLVNRMAEAAERSQSMPAAAALGWQAYGRRDWAKAAEWFAKGIAWSPDHRGPVKLVEGYAASLHNQCRFAEAETVALSRPGDDADGRLRTIYVDTLSDQVSRAKPGVAIPPEDTARLAAATMAAASPNGAQALGWYAYRSRQYQAAAAWFEKAVGWHVTEAEVYGLALADRRLGDEAALERVLETYESRFPSLAAVRRAGIGGREPAVPNFGDHAGPGCAGSSLAVSGTPVGVGSVPPRIEAAAIGETEPATRPAPAVERRSVAAAPVRVAVAPPPPAEPREPAATRDPAASRDPVPAVERRSVAAAPIRVAVASPQAAEPREPAATRDPSPTGSAAAALAAKDYARCLAILSRKPVLGAGDHQTEGWCLLGLERPAEAARAFQAAGRDARGQVASDSALGETLAHLRAGDTDAARDSAGRGTFKAETRQSLGVQILAQQAYDAYGAGRWTETLSLLGRRAGFAAETRDLKMLRGWASFQLGDYEAARRAFAEADAELSDHKSREALATVTTAATPKAFR